MITVFPLVTLPDCDITAALFEKIKEVLPHCQISVDWVNATIIRVRSGDSPFRLPRAEVMLNGDRLVMVLYGRDASLGRFMFELSSEWDLERFFGVLGEAFPVNVFEAAS